MRAIIIIAACVSAIFYSCGSTQSISDYSDEDIMQAIKDKEYVFVANRMLPFKGRSYYLNSYYDVVVSADSVISFLPFFGRAYIAPISPTDGGIRFTSTNFKYSENRRNAGTLNIDIQPEDEIEVQSLYFTIFNNGTASLKVTSLNKTPIDFDGYIIPRK